MFNFLMLGSTQIKKYKKNTKIKTKTWTSNEFKCFIWFNQIRHADLLSKDYKEREEAIDKILRTAQSNMIVKNGDDDRNPDRIVKDPTNKYPLDRNEMNKINKENNIFSKHNP